MLLLMVYIASFNLQESGIQVCAPMMWHPMMQAPSVSLNHCTPTAQLKGDSWAC